MKTYLKYLPLPLLVAAYPVLFLFANNISALELESLAFPLGASLLVAAAAYSAACLFLRNAPNASLSAVAFVVLYYLYGFFYHLLGKWNRFPVKHEILLPLVIALAAVFAFGLAQIKPAVARGIQRVLLTGAAALVIYNLFGVVAPVEAQKILASRPQNLVVPVSTGSPEKKPDIYYIVFDEYAGFEAIRGYWHDDSVDGFESFLKENGFFVATGSRSPTLNTGSEIASRLNMRHYPEKTPHKVKVEAINHNRVMEILKSHGYTTVVMDMAFQGISADVHIQYDPEEVGGMAADEFKKNFLDATMFNAFSGYFKNGTEDAIRQRDMILHALENTADPGPVESPKFVYAHVLLPHEPFILDAQGNFLPPEAHDDWNYYLGQHQYATKLAERLLRKLLANADPQNPPVIILQSDHGARNLATKAADGTITNNRLKKYSGKYMYSILNALYLPGFDKSKLSNNMDPTGTFTIVLNHYLDANVEMERAEVK